MNLTKTILVSFLILFSINLIGQNEIAEIKKSPLVIGETIEFESGILDEKRILNIYLPYGYHPDSTKTYPVIYLLDGAMDEDMIHITGLVQFASFPWINTMPESIVVGIANVDRRGDFTHNTDDKKLKKHIPTSGGSADFMEFIEKEVKPIVESNFKNNETSTIIGQSLGGLLAAEILLKKPQLFDHYIIVSASLWWDNESLVNSAEKLDESVKSVYIAVGEEGKVMKKTAKQLYETLDANKSGDSKVYFEFFENNDHSDTYHLAVYSAFIKLFRKK